MQSFFPELNLPRSLMAFSTNEEAILRRYKASTQRSLRRLNAQLLSMRPELLDSWHAQFMADRHRRSKLHHEDVKSLYSEMIKAVISKTEIDYTTLLLKCKKSVKDQVAISSSNSRYTGRFFGGESWFLLNSELNAIESMLSNFLVEKLLPKYSDENLPSFVVSFSLRDIIS